MLDTIINCRSVLIYRLSGLRKGDELTACAPMSDYDTGMTSWFAFLWIALSSGSASEGLCSWEGNRRSAITLAMRHRLRDLSTYGLEGLRKAYEHCMSTVLPMLHEQHILVCLCWLQICVQHTWTSGRREWGSWAGRQHEDTEKPMYTKPSLSSSQRSSNQASHSAMHL